MNLSIQYLRGIAATLVVFEHFSVFPNIRHFCGAIGVDIFFIISGFIMSMSVRKYKDRRAEFVFNRVVRIYPLYILMLIPAIFLTNKAVNGESIFKALFFIGGSFRFYMDPLLFTGWTLLFEFVFYLIIITFVNYKWFINLLLLSMGIMGMLFTINTSFGYLVNSFYLYFLLGFNLRIILRFFKPRDLLYHIVASLMLFLLVMLFKDQGEDGYIPRQFVSIGVMQVPRVIFWGLPCVYFIASFISYTENCNEIVFLKYVGDRSYSIYLVHSVLILLYKYVPLRVFFLHINSWIYFGVFFLAILPLANLTYNLIEIRFTKWVKMVLRNDI